MPESIDPELASFEEELRDLAPRRGCLDRDALLFAAGRASAKAGRWRGATACLVALSLALGVALAVRPAPPVVERVVYVPVEPETTPEPPTAAPPPAVSRDRLIEQVFLRGLDGLPDASVEDPPLLLPELDPYQ
jgi:hypothetical protein